MKPWAFHSPSYVCGLTASPVRLDHIELHSHVRERDSAGKEVLWLGFLDKISAKMLQGTPRSLPTPCPSKSVLSECWLAMCHPCDDKFRGTWSIKQSIKTIKNYFAWLEKWLSCVESPCCFSRRLEFYSLPPCMWLTTPVTTATGDQTHFLAPWAPACSYTYT